VGAEYFQADGRTGGQTDMTKLIAAFRHFAKTPNKCWKQKVIKMGWEKASGNDGLKYGASS